jgi:hypothetical protein
MDLKIVVVFLMLGLFLSGCIVNESITGTYVLESNNQSYFILKTDGTYTLHFNSGSFQNGSYVFENNYLILKGKTDFSDYYFTKRDNYFLNNVGGIYVKK